MTFANHRRRGIGAGRPASPVPTRSVAGGPPTRRGGIGTSCAIAGVFGGGLPRQILRQNVGIVSMTGVMMAWCRHHRRFKTVPDHLRLCAEDRTADRRRRRCRFRFSVMREGLYPSVRLGGVPKATGINMLASTTKLVSPEHDFLLATSISVGLGLQAVPKSMQHLPDTLEMLEFRACCRSRFWPIVMEPRPSRGCRLITIHPA